QQDGACAAQGLRPDAGAALCDLHGLLRQWRRLLSLFLFGRAWLRPDRAGRHLCARLPAARGGAALRPAAVAKEDPADRQHRAPKGRTMDELNKLGQTIASALGGVVTGQQVILGELAITTTVNELIKVMRFLRDDERCQFVSFVDVTAVDWPSRER